MKIEFDTAKSKLNARERGLPFELAAEFDFETAIIVKDDRHDYGETRYRAIGRLNDDVVAVVFTMRGETIRVISLRIASRKERSSYDNRDEEET
jgi:uncharacterized protein